DDEILIERLGLEEPERTATWLRVLDWTYARGDLFTLQLHPERIGELGPALHATLAEARRRRPSVFIARLDELASWWTRRSGFASTTWREAELLEAIDASGGPLVRLGRWPAGARSALAATGDIDAITLLDFALRSWETRRKPQKERHP